MITVTLSFLFVIWTVVVWWWIRRIGIPAITDRIEARRWSKLHPDMPSWRRVMR